MKIRHILLATFLIPVLSMGQEQKGLSALDQKIADLEARLNQTLDTSPAAAITMLELMDIYHKEGRAFGLVSTGRRFINAQPEHPKHKEVMLKLIDGFLIAARNKDLISVTRQFATLYPDADETAEVERHLARTLDRTGKRQDAAKTYAAAFKRKKGAAHDAGMAVNIYRALNNGTAHKEAAQLALELLNRTSGPIAAKVANIAFDSADRSGDRLLAIKVGNQVLGKNPPITKEQRFNIYTKVAAHYWNEGQKANTIKGYQAALQLKKHEHTHRTLLDYLNQMESKPQEMESHVNKYLKDYPESIYRGSVLAQLAHAYAREKNTSKAGQVAERAILEDPNAHSIAQHYVRWIAADESQHKHVESKLKEALGKAKRNKYALNYALAFELYRDRVKDNDKARATARDLIRNTPVDNHYASNTMNWLLDSHDEKEEEAFKNDAKLIFDAVKKYPENGHYTRYFKEKSAAYKRDGKKWRKQRSNLLAQHAKNISNDANVRNWAAHDVRGKKGIDAREALAKTKLTDEQAKKAIGTHAHHYRHYERNKTPAVKYYGILAKRFPKDIGYANSYLEAANAYGKNEDRKKAIDHMLTIQPESNNSGLWRNLLDAAEKTKEKALITKILAWMHSSESMHGKEIGYASDIGDRLARNGLKAEAKQWWEAHLNIDPNSDENGYLSDRLLKLVEEPDQKIPVIEKLLKVHSSQQGKYASWLADIYFDKKEYGKMEQVLRQACQRRDADPLSEWTMGDNPAQTWVDAIRADKEADDAAKSRIFNLVADTHANSSSGLARLALLELDSAKQVPIIERLKTHRNATLANYNHHHNFDRLMSYAQAAQGRKDYPESAALLTNMLANIPAADKARKDKARSMVAQAYSRMGAIGITVDENSPLAPLLQIGLHLRLGDKASALDSYKANEALFDKHRHELPVDVVLFAANTHVIGGGQENHDRAEDILRSWLVKNGESNQFSPSEKAQIQLLLAQNYNKAGNYDIARNEYLSVINQYKDTKEATEAQFGVGETYMAQKIYDKAGEIFDELANSRFHRIMIRAEFLRGVLAYRQEDRDNARQIFRNVLERMPDAELANETLFNLAEVYGIEQRYMDQLDLLRTVGRLGQRSKRWHTPGMALSIVVQDSDLGISRGHTKIPVIITTKPGGDEETAHLVSGGAGKGLFMTEISTLLGKSESNNGILEIKGGDVITVDYPEAFKNEFKFHILSTNEIHVASDAEFFASSSKIVIEDEETFTQELQEETEEVEQDLRKSIERPDNQIKPGNVVYLRVDDGDRNVSDGPDEIPVKLVATSGDEVTINLQETEAHSGIFEGEVQSAELPAGALASDTAIEYNPLMAIDHDEDSAWRSEPDGATPKWLTVDTKDVHQISKVTLHSPDPNDQAPLRVRLQGSHDGRFWYRIAKYPVGSNPDGLEFGNEKVRITKRSEWKFLDNGKAAPDGWTSKDFDDSEWKSGKGPLGYGQLGYTTPATDVSFGENEEKKYIATFFRKTFDFNSGASSAVTAIKARVLSDDGFILYINGKEVARDNMPEGAAKHTTQASETRGDKDEDRYLKFKIPADSLLEGENVIAAQVHQANSSSSDLGFDLELSYESESLPEGIVQRVYRLGANLTNWASILDMTKNQEPTEAAIVESLKWKLDPEGLDQKIVSSKYAVVWHGKFVQQRAGAVRFQVNGQNTAIMINGELLRDPALKVGGNNNAAGSTDAFLARGLHDITIVTVANNATNGVTAQRARENPNSAEVSIREFRLTDFLPSPELLANFKQEASEAAEEESTETLAEKEESILSFTFPERKLRHLRFVVDEYIGEALAINHVEIEGPDEQYIPTDSDVLALANNNVLEITAGDKVTASYIDELTAGGLQRNRLLTHSLDATYYNGSVDQLVYDFRRQENGEVQQVELDLLRIDPGERIIIEVTDFDMDETADVDSIPVEIQLNNEEPIELTATETDTNSGVFRTEIDTAGASAPATTAEADSTEGATEKAEAEEPDEQEEDTDTPTLTVKAGDQVFLRYLDHQNTFPGHRHHRESVVYVNKPTEGFARIIETRHSAPEIGAKPVSSYLGAEKNAPEDYIGGIAYQLPLTVEVIDPDRAKNSGSKVEVEITVGEGQKHTVECDLSYSYRGTDAPESESENPALFEGRFIGQILLNLGSADSPSLVPRTPDMPNGVTGRVLPPEPEDGAEPEEIPQGSVYVLNLTGPDVAEVSYSDEVRPDEKEMVHKSSARLVTDGFLAITDHNYEQPVEMLHLGEKAYILVIDPDQDVSPERDKIKITVTTEPGEKETFELEETLSHSGAFTGSFPLKAEERPTPESGDGEIEAFFGKGITATYTDPRSGSEVELVLSAEAPIAIGTNGMLSSFSKVFGDEDLAIQTQFHVAESHFELFKSHLDLGREEDAKEDLADGLRVLRELTEDYPNPKYAARVSYLRGQFAQELKNWSEAIEAYEDIIRNHGDNSLASDAQYKLAQCYEEADRFDEALEAYVTLASTYPDSPLIANVMVRINEYFYKNENFPVAATVGQKFTERFQEHELAPKMAFRVGQCYYKAEEFRTAGAAFDLFVKTFPDNKLASEALFWGGESYRMGNNVPEAFRRYNRCRWDFPESDAAKYARGRLALPEMLAQFEREASVADN